MWAPLPRLLTVAAVCVLAGCATQAQRQAQTIATNTRATVAQLEACVLAIYNSPEAEPLRPHLPFKVQEATLQQMTDTSKATDEQVNAIFALHPKLQACRQVELQNLATATPSVVPILVSAFNKDDESLIDLIQRKVTWGDFIRQLKSISLEAQRELTDEGQRIKSNLQRSHEAELAQRQAAANALAQFAQTQALINSMNRPVMTNCTGVGNTVNCVTR